MMIYPIESENIDATLYKRQLQVDIVIYGYITSKQGIQW